MSAAFMDHFIYKESYQVSDWQFKALSLHDFSVVYVEEVGINKCLNDTSKEGNVVKMQLREESVNPVRDV